MKTTKTYVADDGVVFETAAEVPGARGEGSRRSRRWTMLTVTMFAL